MPFVVASRRANTTSLRQRYGEALVIDVTSRGPEPWVRFSPFYPHDGIPVPFSAGATATSVEGVWQGLKVFASADIDPAKLNAVSMHGLKRSSRKHGKVLGHRAGLAGERLLSYAEARRAIYLPTYRWVLENRLLNLVADLQQLGAGQLVVLLDYETNCDIDDLSRPLSHAGLIKRYLEGDWPE